MDPVLYFAPMACSLAARIVATEEEVALAYRQVELYAKRFTDDGGDYRAAAPRGQVPVLLLADGSALTEVSAVLLYLGRRLAGAEGTLERYRVIEGLSFVATELHKQVLAPLGSLQFHDGARQHARAVAPQVIGHVAAVLARRPYFAG